MDRLHYNEMVENLGRLEQGGYLKNRDIVLFGHCNATEELAGLLLDKGYRVRAILDNNGSKHGTSFRNIEILPPDTITSYRTDNTVVCIAARAYEAMARQLRNLGYMGRVEKLADYNSYAEYSLSENTVGRKIERLKRGLRLLEAAKAKYPGCFRLYCPFAALGDVYYMMSYLPYYLEKRGITQYAVFTVGRSCAQVAFMFGAENVEALSQRDMDEQIQAVLYSGDKGAYIPHQDRPYMTSVYKALYIKKISLEALYKYGVFGLPKNCRPHKPTRLETYGRLNEIPKGRAVILSPHAKSVAGIGYEYWERIARHFEAKGYRLYTNASGEEEILPGTLRLDAPLPQMKSVVERAGTFVGLRSGLCDLLQWADCKKIALYPDCFYSDTRWKMEEIYHLDGWENIVIREGEHNGL